jgi:hypothetical protein
MSERMPKAIRAVLIECEYVIHTDEVVTRSAWEMALIVVRFRLFFVLPVSKTIFLKLLSESFECKISTWNEISSYWTCYFMATKLPELEAISIFSSNTRLKASGGLYPLFLYIIALSCLDTGPFVFYYWPLTIALKEDRIINKRINKQDITLAMGRYPFLWVLTIAPNQLWVGYEPGSLVL